MFVKKKMLMIGMACTFLLISGICYSCAFHREMPSLNLNAIDDEQEKVEQDKNMDTSQLQATLIEDDQQGNAYPSSQGNDLDNTRKVSSQLHAEEAGIYAHVCGAVANPGVYKAKQGARVVDFIELSGGLSPEADGDYINQAEIVTDGQRIYIPTKEEVERLDLQEYLQGYSMLGDNKASGNASDNEALININEASVEELMELPGIGQAKANSIIAYRKQHGAFKSTEELMNIPGIKEGLFNQISSKVTVN